MPVSPVNHTELINDTEQLTDEMLGTEREFQAIDTSTAGEGKSLWHKGIIRAVAVKNRSGGALTAGECVTWNTDVTGLTGGPGHAVEGEAGAGAIAAGVVPWNAPSGGYADGDNFWLIRKGPCYVLSDGGNDVAAGEEFTTGATGYVSDGAAGTNRIYGVMIEAIGSVAGAAKKALVNFESPG